MRLRRVITVSVRSMRAVDQVVNSASSAVFSFGLLAASDDQTLGALTMQLIPVTICLGLVRTALYDGLLLRRSEANDDVSGLPPLTGAISGIVVGLIGALVGWAVGLPADLVLAVSLATGAVMLFDGLRFAAFVAGREHVATSADLVWLLGSVVGLGVTALVSTLEPTDVAVIYLVACAAGCGAFACLRPAMNTAVRLIRERATGTDLRFGVDHLLQVIPGYLALVGGGIVASLAAVGQLRAAVILFSPLASAMYAIRLTLLGPDRERRNRHGVPRSVLVYASASAIYTAAVVAAFAVGRSAVGGAAAGLSIGLLVLVGFGEIGRLATQGFIDDARREGRLRLAARIRLEQGLALVLLSLVLAAVWDSTGLGLARLIAHVVPFLVMTILASRSRTAD